MVVWSHLPTVSNLALHHRATLGCEDLRTSMQVSGFRTECVGTTRALTQRRGFFGRRRGRRLSGVGEGGRWPRRRAKRFEVPPQELWVVVGWSRRLWGNDTSNLDFQQTATPSSAGVPGRLQRASLDRLQQSIGATFVLVFEKVGLGGTGLPPHLTCY